MSRRIAIVGGGITGLAAAHALLQLARRERRSVAVTVIEADQRPGGKVRTDRAQGLIIEEGPDSFLARKPWARQLAVELGLGDQLVGTNPDVRKTYVLHRRRFEPLPEDMMLLAPARLGAYWRTPLLSLSGKIRAGLDLLIPPSRAEEDESIGAFVRRRLGGQVAERIADPLLAGIYAGRVDELSLLAVMPQLRELEREHGGILRGLAALRARQASADAGGGPSGRGTGAHEASRRSGSEHGSAVEGRTAPTGSMFQTLRSGLASLVEALGQALPEVRWLLGWRAAAVRRARGAYEVALTNGSSERFDGIVLAVPAFAAAELLAAVVPKAVEPLGGIRYTSTAVVAVAYPCQAVDHPLDATGFVVPAGESRVITGCTWVSVKWPHASPAGQVLLRAFVGRTGFEDMLRLSDEALVEAVGEELRDLMGVRGRPELARVYRWPAAMPQYRVGHLERLARLDEALAEAPGIALAGAGYRGLGVPDCIRQGREAADKLARELLR